MNSPRGTIRASSDETVANVQTNGPRPVQDVAQQVRAGASNRETSASQSTPSPLQGKSLFLNMVLEDYKEEQRESPDLSISHFLERFSGLGNSIRQSAVRLLEVQQYLDGHPELLDLVEQFAWPASGDTVQGFCILEELGRGALSRVYLCQQPDIGKRAVVLKVARGGNYEASVMGRLDHPNIAPVYSIATDAQRHVTFICMPFRGRSTLQDLIDHAFAGALPRRASLISDAAQLWSKPDDQDSSGDSTVFSAETFDGSYVDGVVRLAAQLAAALAHAHRQGILHGDLKPSNTLLTPTGTPLLIDFNLARDRHAGAGPPGGTLPYMAPEQLAGIAAEGAVADSPYDARCEVFSFGAVLFQLLTGKVPFPFGDHQRDPVATAACLLRQQRTTSPRVRTSNPLVNSRLERVVLDCLACDPVVRPQTMEQLHERLRWQLFPPNRACRWALSHKRLVLWTTLLLVLSLILGTTYLVTRPSYAIRQFNRGVALQRAGDYEAALPYFVGAVKADPDFRDARYQRARAEMMSGDLSAAMAGFNQLRTDFNDGASSACIGYCYNLRDQPPAATPHYELALELGFESCGLHNNLGVCYLISQSRYETSQRFDVAERHLNLALELDGESKSARHNLIRVDLARAAYYPTYVPKSGLKHLQILLNDDPADPKLATEAAKLYRILAEREHDPRWLDEGIHTLHTIVEGGGGPTVDELSSNLSFRAYRTHPGFSGLLEAIRNQSVRKDHPAAPMFTDPAPPMWAEGDGD